MRFRVLVSLMVTALAVMALPISAQEKPEAKPAQKPAEKPKSKVITTKSGLQYEEIKVGKGASPKPNQKVSVHYTGWLTNGKKFDSSKDRGEPFEFTLGVDPVIKGWYEGVMTMRVGGKRKLIVPAKLGWGAAGDGPIPPNAVTIFEVELLKIK